MTNKRNTDTKKKICLVLVELLKEKSLDEITVSDISKRAGINRGTFYLHYTDKYDLIETLVNNSITNISNILGEEFLTGDINNLTKTQTIRNVLAYIKENKSFYTALILTEGKSSFTVKFKELFGRIIQSIEHENNSKKKENDLPIDYLIEITISSITSIIFLWIEKGMLESPEKISELISKLTITYIE